MHIVFDKIRFKNFLSVGNVFTEIKLNKNKHTLIVGKNGGGKCVRKSTKIDIKFKNTETENKFKKYLENR
jgi:ABC-type Mn2+/Zn2+ transport system ATPase subunit